MIANVAFDTAFGAVPFAGDVFDVFFKANQRNLRIIHRIMARHEEIDGPREGSDGTA